MSGANPTLSFSLVPDLSAARQGLRDLADEASRGMNVPFASAGSGAIGTGRDLGGSASSPNRYQESLNDQIEASARKFAEAMNKITAAADRAGARISGQAGGGGPISTGGAYSPTFSGGPSTPLLPLTPVSATFSGGSPASPSSLDQYLALGKDNQTRMMEKLKQDLKHRGEVKLFTPGEGSFGEGSFGGASNDLKVAAYRQLAQQSGYQLGQSQTDANGLQTSFSITKPPPGQARIQNVRERTELGGADPQGQIGILQGRLAQAQPGSLREAQVQGQLQQAEQKLAKAKEHEAEAAEKAAQLEARRVARMEQVQAREQQQKARVQQQEERAIQSVSEAEELHAAPSRNARIGILSGRLGSTSPGSIEEVKLLHQIRGEREAGNAEIEGAGDHGLPGGGFARHFGAFAMLRTGEQLIRNQHAYQRDVDLADKPEDLISADVKNRERYGSMFFGLGQYGTALREQVYAPLTGEATTEDIENIQHDTRRRETQNQRMGVEVREGRDINRRLGVASALPGQAREIAQRKGERESREQQYKDEQKAALDENQKRQNLEMEQMERRTRPGWSMGFSKLDRQAAAAGYMDVNKYVTEVVRPAEETQINNDAENRRKAIGANFALKVGKSQKQFEYETRDAQREMAFSTESAQFEEGQTLQRAQGRRGWRQDLAEMQGKNALEGRQAWARAGTPEEQVIAKANMASNVNREVAFRQEHEWQEGEETQGRTSQIDVSRKREGRETMEAQVAEQQEQGRAEMARMMHSFGVMKGPAELAQIAQQAVLTSQRVAETQANFQRQATNINASNQTRTDTGVIGIQTTERATAFRVEGNDVGARYAEIEGQRKTRMRQIQEQERAARDQHGGGWLGNTVAASSAVAFGVDRAQAQAEYQSSRDLLEHQTIRQQQQAIGEATNRAAVSGLQAQGKSWSARAEETVRSTELSGRMLEGPLAPQLRALNLQTGLNQLKGEQRQLQFSEMGEATAMQAGSISGPGFRSTRDAQQQDLSEANKDLQGAIEKLTGELAYSNLGQGFASLF